jgi:general stress protein 26
MFFSLMQVFQATFDHCFRDARRIHARGTLWNVQTGSMTMKDREEALKTIRELVDEIDIAMLTTLDASGRLKSRPLKTQEKMFDGDLWFMTSAASEKVGEISINERVNLSYASKDRNTYVSIAGYASVERDQAKIDELWNDAMKAFFPNGKNDPDIALIRVRIESAEYWDGPGTFIGKALAFLAARVTGDAGAMGKNETVRDI